MAGKRRAPGGYMRPLFSPLICLGIARMPYITRMEGVQTLLF